MFNIPAHDAVRLRHMLDAAHKARAFMRNRSRSELESDLQHDLPTCTAELETVIEMFNRGSSSQVT